MSATDFSVTLSAIDETRMRALAGALALQCVSGDCIALRGDLGAGKTTFARGFIQSLQIQPEEVVSPTFTLVQTYPVRNNMIWHFDLYRLKSAQELVETGLDEALEAGITLIEWPELARGMLPASALDVSIGIGDNAGQRTLSFSGLQSTWQTRLEKLKAMYE